VIALASESAIAFIVISAIADLVGCVNEI